MIDRSKIEGLVRLIRTYRGQLPPLPESDLIGWNERPKRYCEFVEGNLFYLLYSVSFMQEEEFIQTLAKTIEEIKDFSSHLQLHGNLDEVGRAQEKAVAEAMTVVQGILSELFLVPERTD